jgi:hypothetical protein
MSQDSNAHDDELIRQLGRSHMEWLQSVQTADVVLPPEEIELREWLADNRVGEKFTPWWHEKIGRAKDWGLDVPPVWDVLAALFDRLFPDTRNVFNACGDFACVNEEVVCGYLGKNHGLSVNEAKELTLVALAQLLQQDLVQKDKEDLSNKGDVDSTGGGEQNARLRQNARERRRTPWRNVATELVKKMNRGERFTSQGDLAKQLGCSPSTINKAIRETPDLRPWAEKQHGSATGMKSIDDGFVADNMCQEQVGDPTDIPEPADADKAMQYLMKCADDDEKEHINAMTPAERRRLAETAYHDPDVAEQIYTKRRP